METGCCQSGFPSHRSRGHGCLWGSDESSLLREDKKRKEERKEHFRCDGFPDLQVKDSRIYKPERERMRLEKEKETHRGEDRAQRQQNAEGKASSPLHLKIRWSSFAQVLTPRQKPRSCEASSKMTHA